MTTQSAKLKEPSILLASSNCQKLLKNVSYLLEASAVDRLRKEIERNVAALFNLGDDHLAFARGIGAKHWRQRVSRLYYAALNTKRALTLHHSGDFSTDVSDHKNIGVLPNDFPNANTYSTRLEGLRDDRNIADYSHLSAETDLILPAPESETLVTDFQNEVRVYLKGRGVSL